MQTGKLRANRGEGLASQVAEKLIRHKSSIAL